tara:strand:+ start:4757 stop:5254 length:498 start_codon:yes stop_codon:yes gene_type:complete
MRSELHTGDLKVEQKPTLIDGAERPVEIVTVDKMLSKDYLDELAFNEEPVRIRIEPSADKNAARSVPVWVNGKGAEVMMGEGAQRRWVELKYLPVGVPLVVKRKYVEILARTKQDTISTNIVGEETERPENRIERFTSSFATFSVLEDNNPIGRAWLTEMHRRNM